MLCPLTWGEDKWQSMFHRCLIYYHALTVVMRRWQMTAHKSYLRAELSCYVRCHETMTTDGPCFIYEWYITILWPLSWDDANWRSIFHTWVIYHHAMTVVMRRRQMTEHVLSINDKLPCSDCCHETMTSDGASFTEGDITMFWTLSWDDDKWRSIIYNLEMYYHDLTAAMRQWQLTEHASYLRDK